MEPPYNLKKYCYDFASEIWRFRNRSLNFDDGLKKELLKNRSIKPEEVFDDLTGGVFVPDEVWIRFPEKLVSFLSLRTGNGYKYILPTDQGVLLRGVQNYYSFIANKPMEKNYDFMSVIESYSGMMVFIKDLIKIRDQCHSSIYKVYIDLEILDISRNFLLLMINSELQINHMFLPFYEDQNSLKEETQLMDFIFKGYENYFFTSNKSLFDDNSLSNFYCKLLKLYKKTKLLLFKNKNNHLERIARVHREEDCFWKVYVSIKSMKKFISSNTVYVGLMYGALEFPFLIHYLFNVKVGLLNYRGGYLKNRDLIQIQQPKLEKFFLIDDNLLTGRTLDEASSILKNVTGAWVMRRPGLNRVPQMQGLKCFFNTYNHPPLFGMLYPTQYTKIKINTNIFGEYLNELGIFTLTGNRVLELIYKNGVFNPKGEVSRVQRKENFNDNMEKKRNF